MKSKKNFYKLDVEDIKKDEMSRENSAIKLQLAKQYVFAEKSIANIQEV